MCYRNSEHYAAPTEGQAITNVMAEMRYEKRRNRDEQEKAAKEKIWKERQKAREEARAHQRERLAHCEYVLAWKAPAQRNQRMRGNHISKG